MISANQFGGEAMRNKATNGLRQRWVVVGAFLLAISLVRSADAQTVSTFDVVAVTGTITVFSTAAFQGNLILSSGSSVSGVIYSGNVPFIHDVASYNAYVGGSAGSLSMSGSYNSVLGWYAGNANTSASYNSVLGYGAMNGNMYGSHNVALGDFALYSGLEDSPGDYNVGIGDEAMGASFNGYHSIGIGAESLETINNLFAYYNIGIGDSALTGFNGGSYNIAVGYNAGSGVGGFSQGGSNNIFIGQNSSGGDGHGGSVDNAVAIGDGAAVSESNAIVLGSSVTAMHVGVGTSLPATTLDIVGNAQFGSGAAKSTFTSTGLLILAPAGIQWSDGSALTTSSSVFVLNQLNVVSSATVFNSSSTMGSFVFVTTAALSAVNRNGWTTVAASSVTAGSTVMFTGLSSSYTWRVHFNFAWKTAGGVADIRLNNDSSGSYFNMSNGDYANGNATSYTSASDTAVRLMDVAGGASTPVSGWFEVECITPLNVCDVHGSSVYDNSATKGAMSIRGRYTASAPLSSVSVFPSAGTWTGHAWLEVMVAPY